MGKSNHLQEETIMKSQTIKVNIYEYHYTNDDIVDGEVDFQHTDNYSEELELSELVELFNSSNYRGEHSGTYNGWITLYDTNDGTISSIEEGLIIKKDIFFNDIERKAKHFLKIAKLSGVDNIPDNQVYY